jgi:hypothetical protein
MFGVGSEERRKGRQERRRARVGRQVKRVARAADDPSPEVRKSDRDELIVDLQEIAKDGLEMQKDRDNP